MWMGKDWGTVVCGIEKMISWDEKFASWNFVSRGREMGRVFVQFSQNPPLPFVHCDKSKKNKKIFQKPIDK